MIPLRSAPFAALLLRLADNAGTKIRIVAKQNANGLEEKEIVDHKHGKTKVSGEGHEGRRKDSMLVAAFESV